MARRRVVEQVALAAQAVKDGEEIEALEAELVFEGSFVSGEPTEDGENSLEIPAPEDSRKRNRCEPTRRAARRCACTKLAD